MMAEPIDLARKKSKRKRGASFPEPEEVTAEIMEKLQSSRQGLDKTISKYNDYIMRNQHKKRQLFIESCAKRIRILPDGVRSVVAAELLSDEDFAAEMDFSELHTSNGKSGVLHWSCADASLSDTSWRTMLRDYAAPSSTGVDLLWQVTRPTSRAFSPDVLPPTTIAEPTRHTTPMKLPEVSMPRSPPAVEEQDEEDILTTSRVTVPRPRYANDQADSGASQEQVLPSIEKRQAVSGKEKPPRKKVFDVRFWTKEENDTLIQLCRGNVEALQPFRLGSPGFWKHVSDHLPKRSPNACFQKWKLLKGSQEITTNARSAWSEEELLKLARTHAQASDEENWTKIASHMPGRTEGSCKLQYLRRIKGTVFETPRGAESQENAASTAEGNEGVSEEQEQVDLMSRDDIWREMEPSGENPSVL
ncbi:hypothetical protein J7T55_005833 [Diaporthe amygdali]|uniref:uncharacterized protein n=1 Tax=Phomopsis amygdali TaxID=1214568 RepID=UPI0022FE1575|nr:uncharacterized protein J7T55_005833 [Diaporthe amygdali]KAJ0124495.1 hypothetical protein J7T55_005833 [Diaporthe amygdali]